MAAVSSVVPFPVAPKLATDNVVAACALSVSERPARQIPASKILNLFFTTKLPLHWPPGTLGPHAPQGTKASPRQWITCRDSGDPPVWSATHDRAIRTERGAQAPS